MIRPGTILLRLRLLRWRAFLRGCFGSSIRSRLGFGAALLVVCASGLEGLWRHRDALASAPVSRATLCAAATAAILLGWGVGHRAVVGARRDLASAWLSSLPWSDHDRGRALVLACAPAYGLLAALLLGAVLLQGVLAGWRHTAWFAPAGFGLVSVGFAGGCSVARRRSIGARVFSTARYGPVRLAILDRTRPRWLGNWALAGRGGRIAPVRLALLLGLGAMGIAGSIETATAWPAAFTGLFGGHLLFLFVLRCRPLRADALRVLPVPFRRAVWGVARLPLALSLGWFVPPGLAAIAVAPADPTTIGCFAGLLVLDGLALSSFVRLADSPPAATVLHATALSMAAHYALRLGISEAVPALLLVAVLWRGAKHLFIRGR